MNWIKESEEVPLEGLGVVAIYVMPEEDWQTPLWGKAQIYKGIWYGDEMGSMIPIYWLKLEWPEN